MTAPDVDDVQFCVYCAEPFPADDPMVDYDGQTYCSPDCVREFLVNDEPCDHARYVRAVTAFHQMLARIVAQDQQDGGPW